jgi:hypothetical protein
MKTIDEFADEANRAIGRWYGTRMFFAAPRSVAPTFEQFIKAHWRAFPATDPTGGPIVDSARALIGFEPIEPRRSSGDICHDCGSVLMVRTGTCLTCMACGSSSGGCS